LRFNDGETPLTVRAMRADDHIMLGLRDRRVRVAGEIDDDGAARVDVEDRHVIGRVVPYRNEWHVFIDGRERCLVLEDIIQGHTAAEAGGGTLTAPLPATVVAVHVRDGQRVSRGESLMVLEAMKMEHVIAAPDDCHVAKVNYAAGEQVEEGAELIVIDLEGQGRP
jgi:3-methylcrotonyl-CoA carboxylase alpha subunit